MIYHLIGAPIRESLIRGRKFHRTCRRNGKEDDVDSRAIVSQLPTGAWPGKLAGGGSHGYWFTEPTGETALGKCSEQKTDRCPQHRLDAE